MAEQLCSISMRFFVPSFTTADTGCNPGVNQALPYGLTRFRGTARSISHTLFPFPSRQQNIKRHMSLAFSCFLLRNARDDADFQQAIEKVISGKLQL